MIAKQSLVSMVESVLICSGVSTVTVLGLDTLETFVKSKVCISMTIYYQALIPNTSLCTVDMERNETRPVILHSPANITKSLFAAVNLTCVAEGYPLPVFQWYRNGLVIPNAVQAFYYIDQVTPDLRGYYTCEAINRQGAVTSNPGLVTISSEFNTISFIMSM